MRIAICIVVAVALCGSALAKPQARPEKAEGHRPHVVTRQNLDCSSAIPVRIGDFVTSSNVGAPRNVDAYSCNDWDETGGEVVFELTIDEPGAHSVGISIGYDENNFDLDLFVLASCDENDCIYYDNYWSFFDLTGPATYYIVVDGYEGDECPFTLTIVDATPPADCCPLLSVCQTFNFGASPQGYSTLSCGGVPIWDWGTHSQDPLVDCESQTVGNILGPIWTGVTPDDAGEIAILGPVDITLECSCMELCHYYEMEQYYDGGNVKVSTDGGSTWDLVVPASYYDAQDEFLSLSNVCLKGELTYSSEDQPFEFRTDCFDLSDYAGESVLVGLFLATDSSVSRAGWYIDQIRFGSSGTPVEDQSWGAIKALYR